MTDVPFTKNESIHELAQVSIQQMQAWQRLAEEWYTTEIDGQATCPGCGAGIYRTLDGAGNKYQYQDHEILALVTAHLRNRHRDLEARVYQAAGMI